MTTPQLPGKPEQRGGGLGRTTAIAPATASAQAPKTRDAERAENQPLLGERTHAAMSELEKRLRAIPEFHTALVDGFFGGKLAFDLPIEQHEVPWLDVSFQIGEYRFRAEVQIGHYGYPEVETTEEFKLSAQKGTDWRDECLDISLRTRFVTGKDGTPRYTTDGASASLRVSDLSSSVQMSKDEEAVDGTLAAFDNVYAVAIASKPAAEVTP